MKELKFILCLLVLLELLFSESSIIYAQKEEPSKAIQKKTNKQDTNYFMVSCSIGISTTDSVTRADYMTFQANIGFLKPSWIFPICLSIAHSKEITKPPYTSQTDLGITTIIPVYYIPIGGGFLYSAGIFGGGISFGTVRDEKGGASRVRINNFVMPSLICEGEISYAPANFFSFGVKAGFVINKSRTLRSFMLTLRFFSSI